MSQYRYKRIYQGSVQLLVCDLAGTVVDYGSCAPSGAFIELFKRHGIEITEAQAREPMGINKRDHIARIVSMPPVAAAWKELFGHTCNEEEIDKMYAEFIPLQVEILPDFCTPIPNVLEALKEMRLDGIHLAATTGYNREMANIVLKACEENGIHFEASKCSDDVSQGRPAPWMIFKAMEELKMYPPEAVVNVGDTIADIEAGLNAGVWSVGVAQTGNMLGLDLDTVQRMSDPELENQLHDLRKKMFEAGAHFVVDSLEEIESVVMEIELMLGEGMKP